MVLTRVTCVNLLSTARRKDVERRGGVKNAVVTLKKGEATIATIRSPKNYKVLSFSG